MVVFNPGVGFGVVLFGGRTGFFRFGSTVLSWLFGVAAMVGI